MDAESRVLYEHVYEAIIDAGVLTNHFYFLFFIAICDFLININQVNPKTLMDSYTGVYVNGSLNETYHQDYMRSKLCFVGDYTE